MLAIAFCEISIAFVAGFAGTVTFAVENSGSLRRLDDSICHRAPAGWKLRTVSLVRGRSFSVFSLGYARWQTEYHHKILSVHPFELRVRELPTRETFGHFHRPLTLFKVLCNFRSWYLLAIGLKVFCFVEYGWFCLAVKAGLVGSG